MVDNTGSEPAGSAGAESEPAIPTNGEAATYVPYQPALDSGISEEMDRVNFRRLQLIEREFQGGLTPGEEAELEQLQESFFAYLETIFPGPPILDDRLEKLEAKYKSGNNS
jgi:hypothetical protein